eukprot:TRINITY_DN50965_c0_g1_i1.p1 TRINITY_DN50965_c0_g1~~TRINITY_DN50965_c0_g1_i1.p1  ORF type:complete len:1142 (-),score=56.73 TRINITY_DN50965_c0_g1_i1:196-3564(-)
MSSVGQVRRHDRIMLGPVACRRRRCILRIVVTSVCVCSLMLWHHTLLFTTSRTSLCLYPGVTCGLAACDGKWRQRCSQRLAVLADRDPLAVLGDAWLCTLAIQGDVAGVTGAVEAGICPNASGPDGTPALAFAAKGGHAAVVDVLLAAGAEPSKASHQGRTALLSAAFEGHTCVVATLLAARADVDPHFESGGTPLLGAVERGHISVSQQLLAARAEVNYFVPKYGSALALAQEIGQHELVRVLVGAGACYAVASRPHLTPFERATSRGSPAEISDFALRGDINHVFDVAGNGMTALQLAAFTGSPVDSLLAAGADSDIMDDDGLTALHMAAWSGHARLVKNLLQSGARADVQDKKYGQTPLGVAARCGHLPAVQCFLAEGAGVDAASTDGTSALMHAARRGHEAVLEVLLSKSADVEQTTCNGTTALTEAVAGGHINIVTRLLEVRASVGGGGALHVACRDGKNALVQRLLAARADPNEYHRNLAFPLLVSSIGGHAPAVESLLAAGADVDPAASATVAAKLSETIRSWFGEDFMLQLSPNADAVSQMMTPLRLAQAAGHTAVSKVLLEDQRQRGASAQLREASKSSDKILYAMRGMSSLPSDATNGSLADMATFAAEDETRINNALQRFKDSILTRCFYDWEHDLRHDWHYQPSWIKAVVLEKLGIKPHPSLAVRQRALGIRVLGHGSRPEDPVNLKGAPSNEMLAAIETVLTRYFGRSVLLTPVGSCSRLTDLETSDWDYHFEVCGSKVTEGERDDLVRLLRESLNCTARLSERRVAIQLLNGTDEIELVPINSTYADCSTMEFPKFLGSTNRTLVDHGLQLFLTENAGARMAIRELKAAFRDSQPKIPKLLIEHLFKRIALLSICHDPWRGFVTELKEQEAFDVVCHTLEELANLNGSSPHRPFSPLSDLMDDFKPLSWGGTLLAGLNTMASLAGNPLWANSFLLHLEFLINYKRLACEMSVIADPYILPPPRPPYSLFMESSVGSDVYRRFISLMQAPPPSKMLDKTKTDMLKLHFHPDLPGGQPQRFCTLPDDQYVEYVDICFQLWKASMQWWNMTECQRKPWRDMNEFQVQQYLANVPGVPDMSVPTRDYRAHLHPVRASLGAFQTKVARAFGVV